MGVNDPAAKDCIEKIKSAKSPEEAARMGRLMQKQRPDLVCSFVLLTEIQIGVRTDLMILYEEQELILLLTYVHMILMKFLSGHF